MLSSTDLNSIHKAEIVQLVFRKVLSEPGNQGTPKVVKKNIEMIEREIDIAEEQIKNFHKQALSVIAHSKMQVFEDELNQATKRLSDLMVALAMQHTLNSATTKKEGKNLIQKGKSHINKGVRKVDITFGGGMVVSLYATYYRRKGAAGTKGKGCYAELVILGIYASLTPSLISRITHAAVALGSYQEAIDSLRSQGVNISGKLIMKLIRSLSRTARCGQKNMKDRFFEHGIKGKQVVISVDGGRVRIRKIKRGPKTKKKRNHFHTDWREPKLIIIYVANEEGKIDRKYLPIMDGLIAGANAIFALLQQYLLKLELQEAGRILFIADGATWIWDRVTPLFELLKKAGVSCDCLQLLDFYHAIQHLYAFAKCKSSWSSKERKRWVCKQKKKLKEGNVKSVIEAMQKAKKGRRQKGLRTEYNYFVKNKKRMQYKDIASLGLPIGSGAVESAIRRVVNLRMKSPCVFWTQESANAILMLRSYFKAGRWKMMIQAAKIGELMEAAA